jgi:putative transposase
VFSGPIAPLVMTRREGAVMTATLDDVPTRKKDKPEPTAEQKLAGELVARAREQGVSLTGPDGLLKQLTKTVLETALNQEMTEHLGHDKHGPAGNEAGNVRNGSRSKTVLTEATGQVGIEAGRRSRDRRSANDW